MKTCSVTETSFLKNPASLFSLFANTGSSVILNTKRTIRIAQDITPIIGQSSADMMAAIVFINIGKTVSEAHEDILRILCATNSRTVIASMSEVTRTVLSESRKTTRDISIKKTITGVMYFTQFLPFVNLVNNTSAMNSTTVPATIATSEKATVKSRNAAGI